MIPQPPQLFGSLPIFTQAPPQSVKPVGQPVVEHAPAEQVDVGPHALPHAPQFALSDASDVQPPAQTVSPAGQLHTPATQLSPPAHALPHAPQFALSLFRSKHPPLHAVRPVAHDAPHAPAEQTLGDAQGFPQPPQFAGSLPMSTHLPPQSVVPAGHAHAPAAHV